MLQPLNSNFVQLELKIDSEKLFQEYSNIRQSKDFDYSRIFKTIRLPEIPLEEYPYISEIRKELFKHYSFTINFFSFINLLPSVCYSFHRDNKYAIHIPIITNDDSYFIVNDDIIYFKKGFCYILNTLELHTAVNLGTTDRVHLIMGIEP